MPTGDVFQGLIGLLAGLGTALRQRQLEEQNLSLKQAGLLQDVGQFLPTSAKESANALSQLGFLDRLLGRNPPGFYRIGEGNLARFQPHPTMTPELATSLFGEGAANFPGLLGTPIAPKTLLPFAQQAGEQRAIQDALKRAALPEVSPLPTVEGPITPTARP